MCVMRIAVKTHLFLRSVWIVHSIKFHPAAIWKTHFIVSGKLKAAWDTVVIPTATEHPDVATHLLKLQDAHNFIIKKLFSFQIKSEVVTHTPRPNAIQ